MTESTNIGYSSSARDDPHRQFDIYHYSSGSSARPLICFIHGGAWRSEDKADHAPLARSLAKFTQCPVAVPNYRLTPSDAKPDEPIFRHPGHAEDILEFLTFILTWSAAPPDVSIPHRLFLIGHSCSAHMLASIFLDSSDVTPSLSPSRVLLEAVQAIIMSEGIYDLPLLLSSFPQYLRWFIGNTFGLVEDYAPFSVTRLPLRGGNIRWFLIHSRGDTLVDLLQSQSMYDRLVALCGSSAHVSKNFSQLDEDHNIILKGEEYVRIIGSYIKDCI